MDDDTEDEIFERGGELWGRDEHGEYRLNGGTPEPPVQDEYDYRVCGAVLKFTYERYGEKRYCEGVSRRQFVDDAPDFCKHHQARKDMEDQRYENFKTGAFVQSYKTLFNYLPLHKKLTAAEMLRSLMDESTYEFEPEEVGVEIQVRESDLTDEASVEIQLPAPTEQTARGKALWFAALDFVKMENIHEEQFRVAAEETHEGRDLAVGEREKVITVTDEGHEVTDVDEHHLNLPLSRIQKDYERHLTFGGVPIDDGDDTTVEMNAREWVVSVGPEENDAEPEASATDTPFADIETPDVDEDE